MQNQALNALVFLYRYVLKNLLPDEMGGITYAKKKIRVPLVLFVDEVAGLLVQQPKEVLARQGGERLSGADRPAQRRGDRR